MLGIAVFLLGFGVRARDYLSARSLWIDEAALALNILGRGYADLLKPLELNQAAPLGFLILEKASVDLFGPNEYALRLFPFLASLASLLLLYWLLKRLLGTRGAVIGLFLVAISPTAIYYSAEMKQYSFDLLMTLVVLQAFWFFLETEKRGNAALWLGVAGCITLLFSHAVMFVTIGCGLTLVGRALMRGREADWKGLALAGSVVFAAGMANFWFLLRPILANEYFIEAHRPGFPDMSQPSSQTVFHALRRLIHVFDKPLGLHNELLGALVLIFGLIVFVRRGQGMWASAFISVFGVAMGAVMADRYPFEHRFQLFTLPFLTFGIVGGLEGLLQSRDRRLYASGCVLALLLVGETARHTLRDDDFWIPRKKEEIRPMLDYMKGHIQPEDVIYLYRGSATAFRFYADWGSYRGVFENNREISGIRDEEALKELEDVRRAWMLMTHVPDRRESDKWAQIGRLGDMGECIRRIERRGAELRLYEFPASDPEASLPGPPAIR